MRDSLQYHYVSDYSSDYYCCIGTRTTNCKKKKSPKVTILYQPIKKKTPSTAAILCDERRSSQDGGRCALVVESLSLLINYLDDDFTLSESNFLSDLFITELFELPNIIRIWVSRAKCVSGALAKLL